MRKGLSFILTLFVFVSVTIIPDDIYATSRARDEAVNWANSRVGQTAYDKDGTYGAQCVDFILEYYDYLGVSRSSGNGCDYASNTLPSGFTRIQNYYGFVPDPGDIAVWTLGWNSNIYGHVGVITSADLYNVTVADIYGSEAGSPNQLVHSTTYSYNGNGMNFWGVIRPNWTTQPTEPPSEFQYVRSDRRVYKSSESIALYWSGCTNATNYWIYMWKDGAQLYMSDMGTSTSFTSAPTSPGNYTFIVRAGNSAGFNNGANYSFTVTDNIPEPVTNIKTNKSSYEPYDNITFTWNNSYGTEEYWAYLWKDGVQIEINNCWNETRYATKLSGNGRYTLIVRPGNINGFNDASKSYSFSVGRFNVTYNANGGINAPQNQVKEYGVKLTLSNEVPTYNGYIFKGWRTSQNSTVEYKPGDIYTNNSNLTLYAIWERLYSPTITSTIEYNNSEISPSYWVYTDVENLNQPARYITAIYNTDGKVLDFKQMEIPENLIYIDRFLNASPDAAYIKVFLWDLNNKPIAESEKKMIE